MGDSTEHTAQSCPMSATKTQLSDQCAAAFRGMLSAPNGAGADVNPFASIWSTTELSGSEKDQILETAASVVIGSPQDPLDVSRVQKLLTAIATAQPSSVDVVFSSLEKVLQISPTSSYASMVPILREKILDAVEQRPNERKAVVKWLQKLSRVMLDRLSKMHHHKLAADVLLFVAQLMPLTERSGLNLSHAFNSDIEVSISDDDSVLGENASKAFGTTVTIEGNRKALDYQMYRNFWRLQEFCLSPNVAATNQKERANFIATLDAVFLLLEATVDSQVPLTANSSEECVEYDNTADMQAVVDRSLDGLFKQHQEAMQAQGPLATEIPCVLSKQSLLPYQLQDSRFRQVILIQILIMCDTITNVLVVGKKSGSDDKLTDTEKSKLEGYMKRARKALRETGILDSVVNAVLQREQLWVQWKRGLCKAFSQERGTVKRMAVKSQQFTRVKAGNDDGEYVDDEQRKPEAILAELPVIDGGKNIDDDFRENRSVYMGVPTMDELTGPMQSQIMNPDMYDDEAMLMKNDLNFQWKSTRLALSLHSGGGYDMLASELFNELAADHAKGEMVDIGEALDTHVRKFLDAPEPEKEEPEPEEDDEADEGDSKSDDDGENDEAEDGDSSSSSSGEAEASSDDKSEKEDDAESESAKEKESENEDDAMGEGDEDAAEEESQEVSAAADEEEEKPAEKAEIADEKASQPSKEEEPKQGAADNHEMTEAGSEKSKPPSHSSSRTHSSNDRPPNARPPRHDDSHSSNNNRNYRGRGRGGGGQHRNSGNRYNDNNRQQQQQQHGGRGGGRGGYERGGGRPMKRRRNQGQ